MSTQRPSSARAVAALAPFLLAGLALPLLAPSCGDFQPGVKTFAKGSLIIPMDVCYQCTTDGDPSTSPSACGQAGYATPAGDGFATERRACPQATDAGDVVRAYGLVYQLIRNDVAVYWVIDPEKETLDGYDLAIQFNAGLPVQLYDWAANGPGAAPTSASIVRYMGGPFVVDGSDYDRAVAVLQANRTAFQAVNVHVSNVAFQANVAKTMAGGWSAGGAVPPKLALLDIGSGNLSTRTTAPGATCPSAVSSNLACIPTGSTWTCLSNARNAEPVIQEYLARAGIGTGTAGGTAAGPHGEIYDRLGLADFQPATAGGDWTTSAFGRNGYQILWVPHWVAPGSCTDYATECGCLNTRHGRTAAGTEQIDQVLRTIGAFNVAGGDVFAECAGLGSFEGAFDGLTGAAYTTDYQDGDPSTRFQTRTGVRYNQLPTSPFPAADHTPDGQLNFQSPLMQLGDFQYRSYTGAIEDYKPDHTSAADRNYQPGVTRLIGTQRSTSDATQRDWDFFTLRPGTAERGTIVYLAGHSYSGVQGTFQAGGTRLVLNTLFNLGAGCTSTGVACETGQLGACGRGVLRCDASGVPVCTVTTTGTTEECNGLDDDCDGLVDEGLEQACYDLGLSDPTLGRGLCRAGVRTCQPNPDGSHGYSACSGQVLPAAEVCNGLDDDCDGRVDKVPDPLVAGQWVDMTAACYTGPDATRNPPGVGPPVGACREGTQACTNGSWGACLGQVLPVASACDTPESGGEVLDVNCDGRIDTCAPCTEGQQRSCYTGPAGTIGVGPCRAGTQSCAAGAWGICQGEVVPQPEICRDGIDQNCNGPTDDTFAGGCTSCTTSDAQPACWTGPAQVDREGTPVDVVFKATGNHSRCQRGTQACVAGEWGACGQSGGTKQVLPGGEVCNGLDDDCNGLDDDGAECGGTDFACVNGVCVYSRCGTELGCREGYDCVNGSCSQVLPCGTGPACPAGQVCDFGQCVDPSAGLTCGAGSTPAGGYCTGGACYEAGCEAGRVCQAGACVDDPCAGVICPAGAFCRAGDCVQACAFVTCAGGQRCDADGFCVADACAGTSCPPSQICRDGACQADLCLGVSCGSGQVCQPGTCPCTADGCTGTVACAVCADDPCAGVTCPAGQCRDGQCYALTTRTAAGGDGGGGCGCGGGAASPLALLGLLLALPLARRRPRRGAPLALALLAAGLSLAGCTKDEAPFDPASCALLVPPLATCEAESRCVDLTLDPSHCGVCGRACGAGNQCVDGVCGPASPVAPRITALEPTSAPRGALDPVQVVLTGERFQAGATVRATNVTGTTTYPATLRQDGRMEAALDLSAVPTGTWTLRVVNPDRVISNARAFGVVVPTPALSRVVDVSRPTATATPTEVTVGGVRKVRLVGSGLMVDSACRIGGGTLAEQEVASALRPQEGVVPAGLECELDLTRVAPGDYDIWAVNDGTLSSGKLEFRAASATPALDAISPSLVLAGGTVQLDLFGSGFDATSQAVFRVAATGGASTDVPLATALVDAGRLVVSQLDTGRCPAPISGPCPATGAGSPSYRYFLLVRNGALASGTVELFLSSSGSPPAVTQVAPPSAYQGQVVDVTVSGANLLNAGTPTVQARAPGGAFEDLPTVGAPAAGQVTGRLDLSGRPEGSWEIRLSFSAGGGSSTLPFRVLSNVATILSTPAPAGGPQGGTVPVTLAISNLNPPSGAVAGVTVSFSGAPGTPLVPTAPGAGQLAVALPLGGLATGVYTLTVTNPGAVPSNAVNFTVTPGPPRVDAVSPASAAQQVARVAVRITGANFARPDAAGNNGSVVHVFAGCTPVTTVVNGQNKVTCTCSTSSPPPICVPDHVIPTADTTVTSPGQIDVALDTTAAVPGTYSLWVWNPGGSPAPQLSNRLADAFTITP